MIQRHAAILLVPLLPWIRAEAQISLVSQNRTVEVEASAVQATPPLVNQSITAPNAGPFSAIPSVQTGGPLGGAAAWSSQTSSIAADWITGAGATNASASAAFDLAASAQGRAFSTMDVVFDLAFPVRYSATGALNIDTLDAYPSLWLRNSASNVFFLMPINQFGDTPFNLTGTLAPGRYTLSAFADASAGATAWWWIGHRSGFNFDFRVESIVGDNYCSALPNSSGSTAVVGASGSDVVANADLTLHVSGAKPNAAGLFFYGPQQAPQPFGSGLLCVGAPRYRLHSPAQTNAVGALDHVVDFNAAPAGSGASAFAPGVTWNFQFWYRDSAASPTFNTSNGLSIAFQ
jgi:hypothetical protein